MRKNRKKYIAIVLFSLIFIISCYIGVKKNYFKDMGLDFSKAKTNSIVKETESIDKSKPYGGLLTANMNEDINISFKVLKDNRAYNFNVFDYKIARSKDFNYNINFYIDDEEKHLDENKNFKDGYSYMEVKAKITKLSNTDSVQSQELTLSPNVYMLNESGIAKLKNDPKNKCVFSLRGASSTSTMDSKGNIFLKPGETVTITYCFVIPDEYLEDQLFIKFYDESLKAKDPYILLGNIETN